MRWFGIAAAAAVALFIAYGVYGQMTKPPMKPQRIPCQKEVTCFERLYGTPEALSRVVDLLARRHYGIETTTQPSVYMKPRLFDTLDPAEAEAEARRAIERLIPRKAASAGAKAPLRVKFLIYENDKKDPGKKSKKAFLYEGYVVFSFLLEGKTVYKVQVDFMEPEGRDVNRRIDCAVRSLVSLEKE